MTEEDKLEYINERYFFIKSLTLFSTGLISISVTMQ